MRADVITKDISGLVQVSSVAKNVNPTNEDVDVTLRVYKAKNDSVSLTKEIAADLAETEIMIQGVSQQTLSIPADSIAVWQTQVTIPNPDLWSPRKPDLYILRVTLAQGGTVRDEFYTQFGVRTIQAADARIVLNGKTVFLHGVARHEDHPSYGRSVPTSVILSDLKLVKSVDANYLRSAHYPNHPYTYLAADRLGLLVMEEIPVWWFDEAKPWGIQNVVRHIHLQMFREMAFRDRNRPSIGIWSTSNECRDVSGRITFLETVKNDVASQYPDGRFIAQSAAADRPGPYDGSQAYCDVAGWTMYFGIFYDPYGLGMYRGTRNFVLDANDYYPQKPVLATEFGYWSGEDMLQFARQVEVFDSTFLAFAPHLPVLTNGNPNPFGFIAGVTWWCIFDWYTHQQPGGFQSMGLMRMDRAVEKPVFASVKAKYAEYIDISEYITGTEQAKSLPVPQEFSMSQSFPNPSNPSSTISYGIPTRSHVVLSVFNTLGQKVADLVNGDEEPGFYSVRFDATGLASGVYFYRLRAGSHVQTRKMIVVK
jgi:beta-glucuronidase